MRLFRGLGSLCAVAVVCLLAGAPAQVAFPAEFGGPGGGGAGQLSQPFSPAVDNSQSVLDQSAGDVYVADRNNNRVDKFGPKGEFLLAWGWGVADGKAEFEQCGPEASGGPSPCQTGLEGLETGEFELHKENTIAVDSEGTVEHWGRAQTPRDSKLHWWETAGLRRFLARRARNDRSGGRGGDRAGARRCAGAGLLPVDRALHSMLDQLVDIEEDARASQPNLVELYGSTAEAAGRMGMLAERALECARVLEPEHRHELIVAAMASFICRRRRPGWGRRLWLRGRCWTCPGAWRGRRWRFSGAGGWSSGWPARTSERH